MIPGNPEIAAWHYWGAENLSPCGRYVGSVYYGVTGHGYTSDWSAVTCEDCLGKKEA